MTRQELTTTPEPEQQPDERRRLPLIPVLPPDTTPEPRGRNLLDVPLVRRVMTSPLYPRVFQWAVLAGFVFVGYQLLAGPESAHENIGTVLMWVIWWPLIPIVFFLMGRFWCAICPFATLNDWVQKVVGLERPVPPFLKKYGIWLIDASFIAITWADHMWGVVASPWGSGVMVLLLTTAVVVSGALWQRRAFCRYLCFLGGVAGNYSRTAMVTLRADQDICKTCKARAVCYNGSADVPGCPLFSFPRTLDSNATCNLCANCIKNCPNGAISVTVRKPTQELWFMDKPRVEVASLAMAIMGIVLIQNLSMLSVWPTILAAIGSVIGTTFYPIVFTVAFVIAIALPVGLLALASKVAATRSAEGIWQNFARFGYALIPLDVAAHMAHNLFHLLSEGKAVFYTAFPLFGLGMPTDSPALLGPAAIQVLQFTLLALGIAGSLYTCHRIARRRYPGGVHRGLISPYYALVTALGLLNIWMFTLPMLHRV
ncbi:4Fe-4S binding protein [Raineyella sp. LH-20]|uniref:4Fe-4S binding protein n=1 Tax=Raineyella sp. LH-20 TaxID=3081204 RepID=UPI002954C0F5|nr:4Fe-4S binding protein [Raineyella sp. LH-20]WOP18847.1 4Fe-4S binding protein [Raineyella sp. LH-20]